MSFHAIKVTLAKAVINNKSVAVASPIIGLIVEFLLRRWQSDLVLFSLLFFAVAINTLSGVIRAKRTKFIVGNIEKSAFNEKILRSKTSIKMISYLLWLICTYVVALAIKISVFLNDDAGVVMVQTPKALLHYPVTATYLFFILVEILSTRKNILALGVKVPNFSVDSIKKVLPDLEDKDLEDQRNVK